MDLRYELVAAGQRLFRWRSYLPLVMAPLFMVALARGQPLFGDPLLEDAWVLACLMLSLAGLAVRVATVSFVPANTSGRNTSGQKAQTLNTTGMYSVVRHPLYLGNFLIWIGLALATGRWWVAVISGLAFWLYYERVMLAEEDFLARRFGAEFAAWAAVTPAWWPRWGRWRRPALRFCWRTVLKREHATLFAVLMTFVALETASDSAPARRLVVDPECGALFVVGLLAYVVLRGLKKHTRVLDVPGR